MAAGPFGPAFFFEDCAGLELFVSDLRMVDASVRGAFAQGRAHGVEFMRRDLPECCPERWVMTYASACFCMPGVD